MFVSIALWLLLQSNRRQALRVKDTRKNINSFKITEHLLPSNSVLGAHCSDINGCNTCHFTWILVDLMSFQLFLGLRLQFFKRYNGNKMLEQFLIDASLYVFWNVCNISISISLDHFSISKLTKKLLVSFWYAYLHWEIWFFSPSQLESEQYFLLYKLL